MKDIININHGTVILILTFYKEKLLTSAIIYLNFYESKESSKYNQR